MFYLVFLSLSLECLSRRLDYFILSGQQYPYILSLPNVILLTSIIIIFILIVSTCSNCYYYRYLLKYYYMTGNVPRYFSYITSVNSCSNKLVFMLFTLLSNFFPSALVKS